MALVIPDSLFDDFVKIEDLLHQPTCACFTSIDAGLPSQVARMHLRYLHHAGKVVRIDLRQVAADHPNWASSVLQDRDELVRFLDFPWPLPVYVSRSHAFHESIRDGLASVLRELSFMLAIWERVLYCDGPRASWLFHAAVRALREGLSDRVRDVNPLCRISSKQFQSRTINEWFMRVREGHNDYLFENYRAFLTTQLRLLFHFALATASDGACLDRFARYRTPQKDKHVESFDDLSQEGREELLSNLADMFVGLESPSHERYGQAQRVLGKGNFAPPVGALHEGDDQWVRWAWHARVPEEFILGVLAEMNPQHYKLEQVLELARGDSPSGPALEERLRKVNQAWVETIQQRDRVIQF
jgi:hypothetical protein